MESLYDSKGNRLYMNVAERKRFLEASANKSAEIRNFCEILYFTGCRISEALNLKPNSIDLKKKVICFETLGRRKSGLFREVPIPETLLAKLETEYGLGSHKTAKDEKLWIWSRTTAWRNVIIVTEYAQIYGEQATPKGLRHGYGIAGITAGVPLNLLSRWMGHSKIETTAIYANVLKKEERRMAERMWQL